jgi:polyhydroxyalkanoate synthesis repressor PhaR
MLSKSDAAAGKKEPVVIKKYANRRLYNTETSTYVTLEDLAQMVRSERDFVVFDARTGDDLTHSVLTQIIVEQESRAGQTLLPVPFLRQLIRFYGGAMERMVPSYLQVSLETLTREQDRFRKQFANAFTPQGALEAYQEQARKNLQLFEQAMTMFSPFGTGKPGVKPEEPPAAKNEGGEQGAARSDKPASAKPSSGGDAAPESDELAAMRNELAAMQARIEKLAKTKT